jgi:thiol-disulfide isomerase/thioredoxin
VNAARGAGDQYATITDVTTIENPAATVNIEHTAGDVLLIDFWATWCPPCQGPMAHNQKMLEEHGEKWGDKVKIIGLSIDKDAEVVRKHVEAKGWGKPIHYHRAASKYGDTYKVNGVPHVMLVDTNGKIVFKGHPAGRPDLADDLTKLLAGEVLTGEGCAAAEPKEAAAEPGAPLEEGFVACDDAGLAAIHKEMDTYKETTAAALQARAKEDATGLMRDFCVLVLDA